jgi:hypothetical protein
MMMILWVILFVCAIIDRGMGASVVWWDVIQDVYMFEIGFNTWNMGCILKYGMGKVIDG